MKFQMKFILCSALWIKYRMDSRLTQPPCQSGVKWWRPWQAEVQVHECQQSCQLSQCQHCLVSRNPPVEGAVCHSQIVDAQP